MPISELALNIRTRGVGLGREIYNSASSHIDFFNAWEAKEFGITKSNGSLPDF